MIKRGRKKPVTINKIYENERGRSMGKDYAYPEYMFDKTDYGTIKEFFEKNRENLFEKRVVVFGAGVRGGIFGKWITDMGLTAFDYCDNNPQKWGGSVAGHRIISPEELGADTQNSIVLCSLESKDLADEIEQQLSGFGFEKNKNFFSFPTEIYDNYLKLFFEPMTEHLLLLGDCRFTFVSFRDENMETLNDILYTKLREKGIRSKVMSMHALCMRAQYYVIKTQLELGNKPDAIMLPINYETYNGVMNLLSSSQHAELMRRIYEQSGSSDEEFKEYVSLTKERTLNPPFIFSTEPGAESEPVSDKALRMFLKMSYMYRPDPDKEDIVYLRKALRLAKEENIKIFAFVPPLNYMTGKEYFGEAFLDAYKEGISFFRDIILEYDGVFLDQSFLLTEDGFYSKYDKNEIANYEGRIQMADSLIRFLEETGFYEN